MKLKLTILLCLVALCTSGCVLTPDGQLYVPPVDAGVNVDIAPRVHLGSRSNVTVWLHQDYRVSDAYSIASSHCNRWGYYALPLGEWDEYGQEVRYLNYNCVSYRPTISFPHIIIGGNYYRNHNRYNNRRHYRDRRYRDNHNHHDVVSPRPRPNPRSKPSDNGWWGSRNSTNNTNSRPAPRETVTEPRNPWQHNRNRSTIIGRGDSTSSPTKETVREPRKPWEHNRRKKIITGRDNSTVISSPDKETRAEPRKPWQHNKKTKTIIKKKSTPSQRGWWGRNKDSSSNRGSLVRLSVEPRPKRSSNGSLFKDFSSNSKKSRTSRPTIKKRPTVKKTVKTKKRGLIL